MDGEGQRAGSVAGIEYLHPLRSTKGYGRNETRHARRRRRASIRPVTGF